MQNFKAQLYQKVQTICLTKPYHLSIYTKYLVVGFVIRIFKCHYAFYCNLLMIKGEPSGALGYALLCILLGMFYLILPIILFICEFCGVTIRNIVKNKIVFTIGLTIHILLVSYCLLCYIILNIQEHRPFVFLF